MLARQVVGRHRNELQNDPTRRCGNLTASKLHKTIHVYRVQKGFLLGATRVAASNPARRATNPNGNRWPGTLLLRGHGSDSEISWRPRFPMSKIVLGPCRLPCLANGVAGKRAARKFYRGTGIRGGARCRRGGWFFFWHSTQTEYAIFVNSTQRFTDSIATWCQPTWLGFVGSRQGDVARLRCRRKSQTLASPRTFTSTGELLLRNRGKMVSRLVKLSNRGGQVFETQSWQGSCGCARVRFLKGWT